MFRTFLIETDDFRVVSQFKNRTTEKEFQTQTIVAIVFIGMKEMCQSIETAIVTIVSSNTNVETFDAQPDTFMITRQPSIHDQI